MTRDSDPSHRFDALVRQFTEDSHALFGEMSARLESCRADLREARDLAFPAVLALTQILEGRDSFTYGHSRRVARYSIRLAEHLKWPTDQIKLLNMGALLHDIGKVIIPDSVLLKEGKFTPLDFETMQLHSSTSGKIVHRLGFLGEDVENWVLFHHERFDGTGYPDGLKGEEIPIGARIYSLADAYDAMTSVRRYRQKMPHWTALDEITSCGGRQFDPDLANEFSLAMAEPPEE
ncbi:MAG: HD-GYP domain-containing protein [Candidatus Riflebacteria bacterium]|nr:HD-GYP domain-containing protein [Candidatus Riflebacteria bacterium]